jgi:hypothetical protein
LPNAPGQLLVQVRAVLATVDVGIRDVGGRIAKLFREDGLLLKDGNEQFVGVLSVLQRQNVRGIDLVQDLDFAVQVRIVGQRIVLNVADGVGGLK